ncbi:uncharacterized protein LOC141838530 [Curcuma longa]|uniref:uncharacterized protein LOC141838530 n=1 Tax=Curcuma longa TaxID=136217 RepID=UPI003D9F58BE
MSEKKEREGGDGSPSTMASAAEMGETRYKGVRQRKWGRWVTEIRLPNSRERIWLGSYDSPEKAARAFDAASACLRGRRARLNFPQSPPPRIAAARPFSYQQIQAAAARHAASTPPSPILPQPPAGSPALDSPSGESSAGRSEEALDWSFMDSPREAPPDGECVDFPIAMDDFMYDFVSEEPTSPPADGVDSSLWSF